jgi:CubicO group peptidase (beta-lactamase class C family)
MQTYSAVSVSALLAGACIAFTSSAVVPQSTLDEQVQQILRAWQAPGAVITIVKDGRVMLSRGYGSTRVEGGQSVTGSTLASVASVTKTFNSVALALLVDDDVIAWDDPVKKHIPEFEFADRAEQITIRDLISHRAGLPAVLGGLWSSDYSMESTLRDLQTARPRIGLRERVDYSQVGIAVLGEVVARVSMVSWSDFVSNRILEPLGMTSTYASTAAFAAVHPEPRTVPALMGRAMMQDGRVIDGAWRGAGTIYAPAGGIVTTGDDMAKYMLFLLSSGTVAGRQILRPERLRELFTPHGAEGSPYSPVVNPTTSLVRYCLGWITHDYAGHTVVEHPGSNFGSSVVALLPQDGVGVFVSSNANYSLESDKMVSALKFVAIDYALGLERRDWVAVFTTPTGGAR